MPTHQHKYQLARVSEITVPDSHRPRDPGKVDSLAKSIESAGLLEPIGVTKDFRLVYGAHRLAAYKKLGHRKIAAMILDLDDLHAELAEIDENIERHALSEMDEARALARRKEIYEALHPETKAGRSQAAGSNRAQGKHVSDKMSPTFTEDTANKTGQARRTVERKVKIGEKLDPKAAELLRGTSVENSQTKLKALAHLPAEKQRETAAKIKAGKINSVRNDQANSSKHQKAKEGLKGLAIVISALKVCDIYDDYKEPLTRIKDALEHHADEEVVTWTG